VCVCVCEKQIQGERQCACVSVVVTSHRTYHVMSIGELWQVCSISPILLTTQWLCGRNIQWSRGECSVYSLRSRSEAAWQLAESWTQCASPLTQGHSLHWPCAAAVLNTTACSDSRNSVCHPLHCHTMWSILTYPHTQGCQLRFCPVVLEKPWKESLGDFACVTLLLWSHIKRNSSTECLLLAIPSARESGN